MVKKMNPISKFSLLLLLVFLSTFSSIFFLMPIRNAGFVLPGILAIVLFAFYYVFFFSNNEQFNVSTISSKFKKNLIYIFSALFSIAFLFSIRGSQDYLIDNSLLTKSMVYVGSFITVFLFVKGIIVFLLNMNIDVQLKNVSKRKILFYAAPSILFWFLYYIAFFPAGMTPDSLAQWDQAHTGEFNDWHPLIYTWFIMLLTQIWDSPAIVSLAQILILAFIFGYTAYRFEVFGVGKKFLWVIAFLFAISPVNGIYSITIWKDVLYSGFLFFFTMVVLNIVVTRGKWLEGYQSIFVFLLASIGIVFMRHNGFPVFIITLILLLFFYRKHFKQLILVFLLIFSMHYIITGPVFKALEVIPSDPNEALSIPTQQFATIIINDGELTEEQRAYLDSIFPIELWKERFHPYNTNPIKFSWAEYDRDVIFDDFKKYVITWLEVCLQNPKLAVQGFLTHTSLVWQINEPEEPGYTDTFVTNVYYGNEQGILNKVISPTITKYMKAYLTETREMFSPIIWRPATYLFLIILFTFVAYLRNNFKSLLVSVPVLLNAASVMAAMPAQDFRYLFANTIIIFITFIFMFLRFKKSGELTT